MLKTQMTGNAALPKKKDVMKLKITLKDPNGVYESIKHAAEVITVDDAGLDNPELAETMQEKLEEQCKPWIKYGEYVTIEIDTDAGTATVCKV